jgi:hypothetical protein
MSVECSMLSEIGTLLIFRVQAHTDARRIGRRHNVGRVLLLIENQQLSENGSVLTLKVIAHTDAARIRRRHNVGRVLLFNRPMSVYRFPRRALTLCPQLCMGIQPGARCPARSADALPATLYGQFTQAMFRNRPITPLPWHPSR